MLTVAAITGLTPASSHREAPLIAGDPMADNIDAFAFTSSDKLDTVTLMANWLPIQKPNGGPLARECWTCAPCRWAQAPDQEPSSPTTASGQRP